MREIKFRAWEKDTKRMISWEYVQNFQTRVLNSQDYISMQYTGIKDKNGVDIYEGDILKLIVESRFKTRRDFHNRYVEYRGCSFVFVKKHHGKEYALDTTFQPKKNGSLSQYEVIGNIYQNPEII